MFRTLGWLSLVLTAVLASAPSFAKRAAPPVVHPIHGHSITFSVVFEERRCSDAADPGFQVSVVAKDPKGKEKWKTLLYRRAIDCALELDAQEIYPRSMRGVKNQIVIEDEQNTLYRVDARLGRLVDPKRAKVYKKHHEPSKN